MTLPELLTPGERLTIVGGKGGVGKTTTAAALAIALADRGRSVRLVSVDPAHSLGDALGRRLGPEPEPVPGVPGLTAFEVDAETERERFLASHRGALMRLIERGTYLDREDASDLVDRAVPGMDELAALLRLLELTAAPGEPLVLDTAPTGHTLRLLDLPDLARGWLAALEAMEEKHRAVALALTGGYRPDDATALLGSLDRDLARLSALLRDPALTRFVLVSTAEPVVLAETRRYADELTRRGIALGGIVVNRSAAEATEPAQPAKSRQVTEHAQPARDRDGGRARAEAGDGAGMAFVPLLRPEPRGPDGLRRFAAAAGAARGESSAPAGAPSSSAALRVGGEFRAPTDRSLYLVGGKGGVGKSTAAAALAIRLARERGGPLLLLSTDPAGSLGDVLLRPVDGAPAAVEGLPGLRVQQLDAAAAWARFGAEYREETERLFASLAADADRRVVERLVDLSPPGLDELMAVMEVTDALEDGSCDALVIDTAPTGHLLRLLAMPDVALDWAHALLRLLLKYRSVIRIADLAERVLRLTHSLRGLRGRLRDPGATWLLAVALPEGLAVAETGRLLAALRELEVPVGALLVNRLLAGGAVRPEAEAAALELVRAARGLPCAAAPERERGPRGAAELEAFAREWRSLERATPGDTRDPGRR